MTKTTSERCANARRYTGRVFPTCNGGNPCKACLLKYAQVQSGFTETHITQPSCPCGYDPKITSAFDSVAASINKDKRAPSTGDYLKALGHSETFPAMVETICRDMNSVYYVMADAVRQGVAMGRLMEQLETLEEMVGYKEAHE